MSTTSPSSGFSTASNGTNNDEDYTVDNDYYDNPGTYYFRRVISSSTTACDGISDVVTLTVNANPAPVISVDESSGTPDDGTICNGVSVTLDAGSFSSYSWSPGGATSQTINVSPSSTTTYSVTVTNAAGCSGTDNQVITVNPVPVINSISATPPSISCGGSSVLTVVPANNATQTFAQNTTITIPNFGNASPFPSTISVSGLPTSGVSLQNVVFNNLSHEDPDDMDIYLIGPNNQVIWIMSDAGGGTGINNFDLIYADGGTALSTSTLVNNTTYAPDDLTVIEATPGGATLITMLAGFSGNMNGTWSLYIVDDSNDSNSGDLEDWFLTFTYADYTYAWSNGPTTSSQTVMPTATTTYTVTVTTPGTGCSSTANVTVTVTDTEPPMISCPSNISVNNDPGQCCAVVNYTAPVGTDNCTGQTTAQTAGSASGFCFPVGVTTNTFVVTAANSQTATCSFTVTVTDNEPPAIACPSNVSVNNDPGQCCAVVTYTAPVGTDNCTGQSTAQTAGQASGFCFPVGVTTNTFVVTAANSQTATCSFTVTVTDNQPPLISCPSNVSVNNDPGQCCAVVMYTAPVGTDNCTGQTTAQTAGQASGFCFPVGVTTNTFVVTAANSQTATCSFTVTVTDNEAPMISCPSNISVNNDPGQCCAVVTFTAPIGTDNCAGQTTAQTAGQASGFCFPVGVTTNTFVVTAANSQTASCSFTVTVTDNEPPAISCPSNVSVNNDPGQCCAVVMYTAPIGTDNCPGQSTAQTAGQASGFCFPVGVTTNTFVVTAANSQTATCSFTVTVTDNEAPMISCPSNISVNNDPGQCCAVVTTPPPWATDNCPGQSTAQTAGSSQRFLLPCWGDDQHLCGDGGE